MKEKNAELPSYLFEHTPWENGTNPLWPASVFILRRNLAKSHFPPKLKEAQGEHLLSSLQSALFSASQLTGPILLKAEEVLPQDKELLFEHFLQLESFATGSKSQGFVVDTSAKFLALLNVQDHFQCALLDSTGEWEKALNFLNAIEGTVGAKLEFAYLPKFGHLTADPNKCGTALEVLVYLHLPALIHTNQFQEVLLKQKEEEVTATSMQGSLDEIIGDIVILRNKYTLGLSEEDILHALHVTASKFISAEKGARLAFKNKDSTKIKDEISRAFGLLLHSYQLKTTEALSALSLLKLGVDLGWVSGITDNKLNEIFFKCRHAHLLRLFPETKKPEDLDHRRAEFLHEQLKGVELKT